MTIKNCYFGPKHDYDLVIKVPENTGMFYLPSFTLLKTRLSNFIENSGDHNVPVIFCFYLDFIFKMKHFDSNFATYLYTLSHFKNI